MGEREVWRVLGTLSVGSSSGIVALLTALSEGSVGCLNGI